jgi:hypothetical protein
MKRLLRMFLLLAPALVMIGCYESSDVTIKEPGVYKGSIDPLLAKEKSQEQQDKLVARFKLVQMDR